MPVRSPTVVVEQPATQLNFEELYGILSDGAPGQVLTADSGPAAPPPPPVGAAQAA